MLMAGAKWSALLLLIPSCHTDNQLVDRVGQPILAGTPSGPTDDAVVHIRVGQRYCSGVLVAPNLILTARYCLLELDSTEDQCNADGTSVVGTNIVPAQNVDAAQIEIRTGATPSVEARAKGLEIVSLESPTFCRNDIALVVLDRHLDHWPTLPTRLTRPTSIGENMTVIGYGQTGATIDGVDQPDAGVEESPILARFRREGVPVLDVGANRFYAGAGSVPPGTLLLGPGTCGGDLGSPALSEATLALVGVASVNSLRDICTESAVSTYAQVAEYYDLVLEAFARAGAEPWIEGEAAPMQSSVSADSGCTLASEPSKTTGRSWFGLALGCGVALELRRRRRGSTPAC